MRRVELDLLRVIATLAVIAIHVSSGYMTISKGAYVVNQAARFAVPLFVIMSGLVNFYQDQNNQWMKAKVYLSKRFNRVLIPYILWTFFYVGLTCSQSPIPLALTTCIANLGRSLLLGTGYIHLYFFVVIIQLYILYLVLRYWLNHRPQLTLWLSFGLTLGTQTLLYLCQLGFIHLPASPVPYVIMFPLWIFFFVFGMWFAADYENNSKGVFKLFPLLIVGWVITLLAVVIEGYKLKTGVSSLRPDVILYTLMTFGILLAGGIGCKAWLLRYQKQIVWFSNQTMLVFLVHPFIIWLLIKQWPYLWSEYKVLLYFSVLLISLFISSLISKWKYAGYLGGVYTGPKQIFNSANNRQS